jgi:DNA-binding IclR family transcriptional regulator
VGTESIARTAGVGREEVASTLVRLKTHGLVEEADGHWRLGPAAVEPAS